MVIDTPLNIEISIEDKNKPSPPIKVMGIAMKYIVNAKRSKEICMISLIHHNSIECDRQTLNPKNRYQTFSIIRKLDKIPTPPNFERDLRNEKNVSYFLSEKAMLERFVTYISTTDPDMLVAHGL